MVTINVLLALLGLVSTETIVLQDGTELPGPIKAFSEAGLVVEGQKDPLPLYDVNSISFGEKTGEAAVQPKFSAGPIVCFREGETIAARVVEATGNRATIEIESPASGKVVLAVPLDVLKGFRLREANPGDDVFEVDLAAPQSAASRAPREGAGRGGESEGPPATSLESVPGGALPADGSPGAAPGASSRSDVVYVRRPNGLLRVEGVFRSLDAETLTMDFEGQQRQLRRQLVSGVVFAPVASRTVESDLPAIFELEGKGQIPAVFKGFRGEGTGRELLLRFRGAPSEELGALPGSLVRRVRFFSDRVLFLSSINPVKVEETPLLGPSTAPWRRDLASSGGPLTLAGRVYRRGIGVHSRSVLEFDLGGQYRAVAAVIGLDDSAGEGSGVIFRVVADGKEIHTKSVAYGDKPGNISLPINGVKRLRLEVDYGDDGVDFGDYADWADLRVTR